MKNDQVGPFPRLWRLPDLASGILPCLRGTGVIASFAADLFAAGDSIERIAEEYGVPEATIIEAIRLAVASTHGQRGTYAQCERRMCALVPLETREEAVCSVCSVAFGEWHDAEWCEIVRAKAGSAVIGDK
jgi:uncharacterized protein (DUF433 family)